jgi:hypothetical protein
MSKIFSTVALIVFVLLAAKPSFASGGTCPSGNTTIDPNGNPISLSSLGITSCFYISKSTGSDTNAGTTEAAPWAHAPRMPSCTGTCAATTPAAGEGFIFKGGDSWTSADVGFDITSSGTSSNPIYWGPDKTWFNSSVCGSSWCRPILDSQSTSTQNVWKWQSTNSWHIVDNFEMIGMRNNQNGFLFQGASNMRATQMYIHGWGHTGNQDNVGMFTQCGPGTNVDHNIVDGADSTKNTFNGVFSSCAGTIAYNYFSYLVSGVLGNTDIIHDNVVLNTVTSVDGDHCNGVFTFSPASGNGQIIYNNYINNGNSCQGGVVLWFNGNGSPIPSSVNFGFNNVLWGLSSNPVNIGNHATGSYGTYYWFNNTVDCSLGGCGGAPGNGYWVMNDNNNHLIPGPLNFDSSAFGGATPPVCNKGVKGTSGGCTDLTQTESVANGQGYTSTEKFPYSPISSCTSSSCSTVQAGTNLTSTYCSTLSGINPVAGTACSKGTSVACAYNTSNHTLSCPNDAAITRPSTGAWDIGAYQLGPGQQLGAPTHLSGTVTP